jgi:hypothetical protein
MIDPQEEYQIIYRQCLKYLTYIPANGYLWVDIDGEWHGLYETERDAFEAFIEYLKGI